MEVRGRCRLWETMRETHLKITFVTVPQHVFHCVLCSESETLARVWLDGSSHIRWCCGAGITNLNEPPSSFLLPPRYCGLGAGSIPLRAIVNKKQCETRGLFMSLVIHYWIDVQYVIVLCWCFMGTCKMLIILFLCLDGWYFTIFRFCFTIFMFCFYWFFCISVRVLTMLAASIDGFLLFWPRETSTRGALTKQWLSRITTSKLHINALTALKNT